MKNKPYPLYDAENINTLKELLMLCRDKYSGRRAFWYADNKGNITEKSYDDFVRDVISLGGYIRSKRAVGAHMAVYGENSYEWLVVYFAAVCGGNVIVPIDKELSPAEASEIIRRSGSDLLFYSGMYADEAGSIQADGLEKICMNDIAGLSAGDYVSEYELLNIAPETLATIVYTSGTTGRPKGVMLTHKNIARDAVGASRNLFVPDGTILLLPLHHTFGLMAGVLCQLLRGYSVFINKSLRFLQRDIQIAKPAHLSVVPMIIEALYKKVWENAEKQGKAALLRRMVKLSNVLLKCGIDLRKKLFKSVIDGFGGRLEMLISGGAAIDPELIDGINAFGIKAVNGYGITESSPIVATTRNEHNNYPSVGCVIPGCNVKIVDPDSDGIGEIYLSGDVVTEGYYMDDEANAECFEDNWFKTGDLGYIDDSGFLHITGRKKNLIILSNGKNVSPEELEFGVAKLDNVLEVIIYDEDGLITAEIYAENTEGIRAGIEAYNKTLPSYKQIQRIKFRDVEFEKTSTKKIKR